MGPPTTATTQLRMLYFELVCSLHGGAYARTKEHARNQRRYFILIRLHNQKVVSSDPNNNGSKRIVRS